VVEEIGGVKSYGQSENITQYTIYSNTLLDILIYCQVETTNNRKYRPKQNKYIQTAHSVAVNVRSIKKLAFAVPKLTRMLKMK